MNLTYAGIGSRNTPADIILKMSLTARHFRLQGYTLYSGGAKGADSAFEAFAGDLKKIFLPYDGFNGRKIDNIRYFGYTEEAWKMASFYHPNWKNLSQPAKRFHARNCHQVLGLDLQSPVDFVYCYTEGGKLVGGTAQALRIANDHNIEVHNFGTNYDAG